MNNWSHSWCDFSYQLHDACLVICLIKQIAAGIANVQRILSSILDCVERLGYNVLCKRAIHCGLQGIRNVCRPGKRWLDQQGDLE